MPRIVPITRRPRDRPERGATRSRCQPAPGFYVTINLIRVLPAQGHLAGTKGASFRKGFEA